VPRGDRTGPPSNAGGARDGRGGGKGRAGGRGAGAKTGGRRGDCK